MVNMRMVIKVLIFGTLAPGLVYGQTVRQPVAAHTVGLAGAGFEYRESMSPYWPIPAMPTAEEASPSPSDQPQAAGDDAAQGKVQGNSGGPCDCAIGSAACQVCGGWGCGCCCHCCLGDPWRLPQPCLLRQYNIKVGGWLQQGITFNATRPADAFNGPLATNDRDSEYQLNQLWLYVMRPVDTGGCGFDIGGRFDLVYGTDWRFGQNVGLEDNIDSNQQFYGLVLPQFYLEVGWNRLSVKLGHFATSFGYEDVPAVANFFYSHSYAMSYGEPLLVTGMLAEYKLTERLSVDAGFHRGWYMFEDTNNALDVIGGVKWTSFSKRTSAKFHVSSGPQNQPGLESNWFCYTLVVDQAVTQRLRYIFQHDLGVINDGNFRTGRDTRWYGINQHLLYTINPCWAAGMRFEWFRDDGGGRVVGVGNWINSQRGWRGGPGFDGNFYELSLGLNWHPHANLLLRPEIRWDWYSGSTDLFGRRPFDGGNRNDQFTFALDLVTTF